MFKGGHPEWRSRKQHREWDRYVVKDASDLYFMDIQFEKGKFAGWTTSLWSARTYQCMRDARQAIERARHTNKAELTAAKVKMVEVK